MRWGGRGGRCRRRRVGWVGHHHQPHSRRNKNNTQDTRHGSSGHGAGRGGGLLRQRPTACAMGSGAAAEGVCARPPPLVGVSSVRRNSRSAHTSPLPPCPVKEGLTVGNETVGVGQRGVVPGRVRQSRDSPGIPAVYRVRLAVFAHTPIAHTIRVASRPRAAPCTERCGAPTPSAGKLPKVVASGDGQPTHRGLKRRHTLSSAHLPSTTADPPSPHPVPDAPSLESPPRGWEAPARGAPISQCEGRHIWQHRQHRVPAGGVGRTRPGPSPTGAVRAAPGHSGRGLSVLQRLPPSDGYGRG